jgi:hypothetical protein
MKVLSERDLLTNRLSRSPVSARADSLSTAGHVLTEEHMSALLKRRKGRNGAIALAIVIGVAVLLPWAPVSPLPTT